MTEPAQKPPLQRDTESPPRRALVVACAAGLLFLVLAVVGYRWAKQEALAKLVELSGQPERDTAGALHQWQAAQPGDDFEAGDGARTPANATAAFRLINGASLRLKPSSQVRFQRPGDSQRIKVDVEMGSADLLSTGGAVAVDSEFGEILLDANSSVTLRRNGQALGVSVEVGSIQLANRRLIPGQWLQLELGGIVVDVPVAEPPATPTATASATANVPETPPLELGDGIDSAELVARPGQSFVVHDPNPPTSIGFTVSEVCDGPARLVVGKRTTEAVGQANLRFPKGQYNYQIRCLDEPEKIAAKGRVRVLRDSGTRKLPTFKPTANVTTDGRRYTVLYQHRLPRVTVNWPTAPQTERYTLTFNGKKISTRAPRHTIASLPKGKHRLQFSADTTPKRQSRTSIVEVQYDAQAPAARVSNPPLGFAAGETVSINGQALPGWKVSLGGKEVAVDGANNFSTELKGDSTIPIVFSHPSRGTHYYLRRPRPTP